MDSDYQLSLIQFVLSFLVIIFMCMSYELLGYFKRERIAHDTIKEVPVDLDSLEKSLFIGMED